VSVMACYGVTFTNFMHHMFNKIFDATFIDCYSSNINLPLTNNSTQCSVSADIPSVYTIQLLSVQNNIPVNQNVLYIH